jgi:hypothetical protein
VWAPNQSSPRGPASTRRQYRIATVVGIRRAARHAPQHRQGAAQLIAAHRNHHEVVAVPRRHRGHDRSGQRQPLARLGIHQRKAAGLQVSQSVTARQQYDVMTDLRELGAVHAADDTGAYHQYSHPDILSTPRRGPADGYANIAAGYRQRSFDAPRRSGMEGRVRTVRNSRAGGRLPPPRAVAAE